MAFEITELKTANFKQRPGDLLLEKIHFCFANKTCVIIFHLTFLNKYRYFGKCEIFI